MPDSDLRSAIDAVNYQLKQIAYRWEIFRQLFDSGQENIDLLNRSGSNVFGLMLRLIIDDVLISLSKLTDPKSDASGNENASINNVIAKANASLLVATRAEIEALRSELNAQVENIRKHRNKALAHADMTHALNVSLLPPVTYDELEKALKLLQEILAKVALEPCKWAIPVGYSVIIPYGTDGNALLNALKRGH